jgi:hypothetical protein
LKTQIDTIRRTQNLDPLFEQKFSRVTADLKRYRIKQLRNVGESNLELLTEYLNSKIREGNLKPATRASTIDRLFRLSLHHRQKSFRQMTTEDVYSYIDTIRRTESDDPLHKWIGSYNLSVTKIISFFKWLYEPDAHSTKRHVPSFLSNLKCLKRKEKTTLSPKDLWTHEEDLLFLKYCPDKRLRL